MRTHNNILAAFLALALLVPSIATAQHDQDTQKDRARDKNQRDQQQVQQVQQDQQYQQDRQDRQDRQDQQVQRDQRANQNFQPRLHQADELIGATVKNTQGEEIGNIKDLVMDSQHQNVSYAVLAFGGFLGLGKDLRAIPWQALTIQRGASGSEERGMRTDRSGRDRDQDNEISIVLNASKEQLENAEGFSDDNWPDTGNERWTQDVRSSFDGKTDNQGRESTTMADRNTDADRRYRDKVGEQKAMKSRRLSNVMGETMKDHRDEDIGEIETVLIDANRGALAYAVVDVSDLDDLGDTEQVAIPWRALQTRGDELTLTTEVASLDRMKYARDGRNQLENRARASEQHALCKTEPYWQGPDDASQRDGQSPQRGTGQDDRYGTQAATTTITGKITKVMNEDGDLRFEVMTDDGRRIIVDAGRKSLADQSSSEGPQQTKFKKGDQVTVTGTQQTMGDGQATFMAQTIRSGSGELDVQRTGQDRKRDNK
ncbi:MAG: PRC-barrel domain-containing protein [Candidatus Krumholzibacteriia bacterium]